jgi:hypothetical protein
VRYDAVEYVVRPANALLSALAYLGQRDEQSVAAAFEAGVHTLNWPEARMQLLPADQAGLAAVSQALSVLAESAPRLKKHVLGACAAVVDADGQVTVEESELVRAIADALDSPMPVLYGEPASVG